MAAIDRPNATMEAAVFHGNKRITIERVAIPDVNAGEVLVRVSRTALCGSDFKLWHKGAEFTAGHEIFGVVEQPGHRMHGRRCAVYIPVHCDHCAASDIEDRLAPLLLDTIGTSAHAVRFVSRVVPPQEAGPVLVTGAGPVGLGVILALKDAGYSDIHVSDPNVWRLRIAQAFGAQGHPVGDTGKRFALIIECSGAHAARNLGIEVVLPRGALVLVGENASPWTIEEGKVFRRKDFYMIRTFYFPVGDFEANITLLRRFKDEYRVLVDGEFGLRELPQNFARFAEGKLIKPVLALETR